MEADKARTVLEGLEVAKWPGVYVLGSIDRRVTVYSQQVRALNLAAALMASERLKPGDAAVVVGAGAAGLTCAAGLSRLGAKVTVLEAQAEVLPVFRGGSTRWLHPGVYDWPLPGWSRDRAGLPLLDWSHGLVPAVRAEMEAGWRKVVDQGKVVVHLRASRIRLGDASDAQRTVTWNPRGSQRTTTVILAVGFGLEPTLLPTERRYWEGDDLDAARIDGRPCRWLVSGCGDGALTDLLRLCLKDFQHDQMLQDFTRDPRMQGVRDEIRRIENHAAIQDDPIKLHCTYAELEAPWIVEAMQGRARHDTVVTLNAPIAEFLTRGASALNRFLVGQLYHAGRFELLPGTLAQTQPDGDNVTVTFGDKTFESFHRLVRRHGPESALSKSFPLVAEAVENERILRRDKSTLLDQTRTRFWTEGCFGPEIREVRDPDVKSSVLNAPPRETLAEPSEQYGDSPPRRGSPLDAALASTFTAHASPSGRPTPAFPDAATKALSEQLEDIRVRRQKLREAGLATNQLDSETMEVRRRLREGGQLRAGDALDKDRYLLVKTVGRGGFAVVWDAYDRTDQRHVAIKVLHANLAGDPLRRERFFRGARAMRNLVHPAVVRVLEPKGEDGGFYYFVMELLSGGNLREAVLASRLAKENALPLILRVSEAVAEAHSKGMVHRDIKPANILLDGEGNPKLTDFDLVGAHDTTGGTRTGALGTFVYAAPECLERPQEATARADVYGLGMTMLFCLSGQDLPPSTFRNSEPLITRLAYSISLREVLRCAVAWEPSDRFADAAVMGAALRATLGAPNSLESTGDEQNQIVNNARVSNDLRNAPEDTDNDPIIRMRRDEMERGSILAFP